MTTSPTYSLLGPRVTPPSEYEIVTSNLHPYVQRGFEVNVPLADWYRRYQTGSPFRCTDWERFADPRETTYTTYTRLQRDQERETDAILAAIERDRAPLPAIWSASLGPALSAVRFPLHGFHMIASYIGQMAPAGRLTMLGLFQSADELRRIERLAYRLEVLQRPDRELDAAGRRAWQLDPAWQPLRETIERLLVTYDWGEAFVGLNLCLKPMLDELVVEHWARVAGELGDPRFAALLVAFHEDCSWQRAWSSALARWVLARASPGCREAIDGWTAHWAPRARHAVHAVAPRFSVDTHRVVEIAAAHAALLEGVGLQGGAG